MTRVKVFGRFVCVDCGRRVPYVWQSVQGQAVVGDVRCFKCAAVAEARAEVKRWEDYAIDRWIDELLERESKK